ncbi:MAG: hypothetical protein ACF8Q5_11410 [Phycisphaerales bacterium JB040]
MHTRTVALVLASALAAPCVAQDLAASQRPIARLLGGWSVDGSWAGGAPMRAMAVYTPGIQGQFLYSNVLAHDEEGNPYERYFTVLRQTDAGVDCIDFVYDGTINEVTLEPAGEGAWTAEWPLDDSTIAERIAFDGDDSLDWTVWSVAEDGGRTLMLEDSWERIDPGSVEFPERPDALSGPVAAMSRFLGEWTIDADWADGSTLQARNVFTVGVNGKFLEAVTYANDNSQGEYARYFTVYAHDAETDRLVGHGFDFAGSYSPVAFELSEDGRVLETENPMGEGDSAPTLRQRLTFTSDDAYRWQVWMKPAGAPEFVPMMDGVWNRVIDGTHAGG